MIMLGISPLVPTVIVVHISDIEVSGITIMHTMYSSYDIVISASVVLCWELDAAAIF